MDRANIKAGEAFLALMNQKPGGFDAMKRAMEPIARMAAALGVMAKLQAGRSAAISAAQAEAVREYEKANAEWAAKYGEPCPESLEDWSRWAMRLGLSAEQALHLDPPPRQLEPLIEGHLLRLRDQEAGKRTADSKTDNGQATPTIPENSKVLELARRLNRLPTIKRGDKTATALDLAAKDEKAAETLLRELRRYPHLLKSEKT